MKRNQWYLKLNALIGIGLLSLLGCSYLPLSSDDTTTEKVTTQDTVTEEILGEFQTALVAAVPAATSASSKVSPNLKSRGVKHEGEVTNLTEEDIPLIIDAARKQAALDGVDGDNVDITEIIPSLIAGIADGLDESIDLSVSEKVDGLNVAAESALRSVATRQDETYIPLDSRPEGTTDDSAAAMANIISGSCISHLPNLGVKTSELANNAGLIASKIVEKISLIVSVPEQASNVINQIAKGSSKGMDISGFTAADTQSIIGGISKGMIAGLANINTSKLPIKPADYAGISENMQRGIAKGLSGYTNASFKPDDVQKITSESFNQMMEGFSQVKTEGFTFDHINAISQQASSAIMGSVGTYFPSFNQEDFSSISKGFMGGTLQSIDHFSSRSDYSGEAVINYASSMMAGFTVGAAQIARVREFDPAKSQSILDAGMTGYVQGTNNISTLDTAYLPKLIGSGAQAYTGAIGNFIEAAGYSQDYMSGFITKGAEGFVSNIGEIHRSNYTVAANVSEIVNSVSKYGSQGLQNLGISADKVNNYMQSMSQGVSSNIAAIRIDGSALNSSDAQKALEYSSSGFTSSLAVFQNTFQSRGEVFDISAAQNFVAAGQVEGSKVLVSAYNFSQNDITSRIQGGIQSGAIGYFDVSSSLASNLSSYYSQYVAIPPPVYTAPIYNTPIYTAASSGGSASGSSSSGAPLILSSSPLSNAIDVALDSVININFSVPMDVASLNNTNISFYETYSNPRADISAQYSATPTRDGVLITPPAAGGLRNNISYTVIIGIGVKSSDGIACAAPQSITFTTIASYSSGCTAASGPACGGSSGGSLPTETSCGDNIDNDNDGRIDCQDSDCSVYPTCAPASGGAAGGSSGGSSPTETSCGDNIDNDNDGRIDCQDSDCSAYPTCAPASPPPAGGGAAGGSSPSVMTTSPLSGATNVDPALALSITFSGAMDPTTLNSSNIILSPTNSPPGMGSMQAQYSPMPDGSRVNITPSSALGASTGYTVLITTSVKSVGGTALASSYSFNFTTSNGGAAAPPPPAPPPPSPPAGLSMSTNISPTGLPRDANIVLSFAGETIGCATVSSSNIYISNVTASLTCDAAMNRITLDPASTLPANSTFGLTIGSGITSTAGTVLSPQTITFTTGAN